jgi:hypothetical protein
VSTPGRDVEVVGGVGGLEVQYDELARASKRLAGEGVNLLGLAASRHRMLADGDLLASAVLSPSSFARVEAALLSALDGGDGVVAAGLVLERRSGQLLVAVARYRASDALADDVDRARRWLLVAASPLMLPVHLAKGGAWAYDVVASGGDPLAELERALVNHPGLVDDVIGGLTDVTGALGNGLAGPLPVFADQAFRAITGEALLPGDLEEAAAMIALLYAPGRPVWTPRNDPHEKAALAPGGVGDLIDRLHHRNDKADQGTVREGDIGVTRVVTVGPDGRELVSWIVDIPGTKDWQHKPGERPALNDLASNLELMAGIENARVDALAGILAEADVADGQPVMLVGHSQGGMVAMRAAQELSGRFDVTHVVTAGSPVGGMPVPRGVQVLSLENRFDIVPHTDGRPNADDADHVTVLFDHPGATISENHGTGSAYLPAARDLDVSSDPSVRAWIDGAQDFLAGRGERATATTTVYSVSNDRDGDGRVDPRPAKAADDEER